MQVFTFFNIEVKVFAPILKIVSEIWGVFSDGDGEMGVVSENWGVFSDGDGEMGVVSENWGVFSDREGGTGVRCG